MVILCSNQNLKLKLMSYFIIIMGDLWGLESQALNAIVTFNEY